MGCLVVVLHALVWLLLWYGARPATLVHGKEAAMTWIRLAPEVETLPRPAPTGSAPPQRRPDPDQAEASSHESSAVTLPPRPIDWSAQAAFSARKAVEDAVTERYRSFGPRPTEPGTPTGPPSLFSPERKSFGETDRDINDNPIVRLNENCYFELDDLVLTARDLSGSGLPPMVKCSFKAGSREPRSDLFEHLKRDRPLPAPRDGVPGELPELPDQDQRPSGSEPDDPPPAP